MTILANMTDAQKAELAAALNPLGLAASTAAPGSALDNRLNDLDNRINNMTPATTFVSASTTITSNMVNGIDPVLGADPVRRIALMRSPKAAEFVLHQGSSDTAFRLLAEEPQEIAARNAIYLKSGLIAGDRLTIEVG